MVKLNHIKATSTLKFEFMKSIALLSLLCAATFIGCNKTEQASVNQNDSEIERLRQENQDLAKLREENEETQRLRKENQDIHKLRGQYQELGRVRKENEELKKQAAKLGVASAQSLTPAQLGTLRPDENYLSNTGKPFGERAATEGQTSTTNETDLPQEGDEIMVDPKFLAVLLPDIDWTKLNRTEPINIKGILESQNIVLTNYQELIGRGITNYVVRRARKVQQAPQQQP